MHRDLGGARHLKLGDYITLPFLVQLQVSPVSKGNVSERDT